jgi:hypothetical protein
MPADSTTADEAGEAVEAAELLVSAAGNLLGQLSFFRSAGQSG